MISRDVEIPGGSVVFSPEVLFVRDADAQNVKLVVGRAV